MKIIKVVLLSFLSFQTLANAQVSKPPKGWPPPMQPVRPSNEPIQVEKQDMFITVSADGSQRSEETSSLRALNDTGKVDLSLQVVQFDPKSEDVKIVDAFIETKGKVTKVDLSKIKLVTAKSGHGSSPGLDNKHSYEIPFDGISIGSVTTFKLIRRSIKPPEGGVYGLILSYGMIPEISGTVQITSDQPLYFHQSGPLDFVKIESGVAGGKHKLSVTLQRPAMHWDKEQLKQAAPYELKNMIGRVDISSRDSWKSLVDSGIKRYSTPSLDKLPNSLKTVVAKIQQEKKTPKEKVEGTLKWLAENFTYSGRWLSGGMWNPRDLNILVKSGTGDCKDFAFVSLSILRAMGIEAEPVYVGVLDPAAGINNIFSLPIDYKKPLVALQYFNHVVVRYKDGDSWYTIEPGRGVAEARLLPHSLIGAWAINVGAQSTEPYRFMKFDENYAGVDFTTSINKSGDGAFEVTSDLNITGEFANYLRELYFREGPKKFEVAIKTVVPGEPLSFQIKDQKILTRDAGPLKFKIDYSLADLHDKGDLNYPVHVLPYFAASDPATRQPFRFPYMPMKITEEIQIKDRFAWKEEQADCLVRGPITSVDRRVTNGQTGVKIVDKIELFQIYEDSVIHKDKDRMSQHLHDISDCFHGGQLSFAKLNLKDPTQVSFDAKVDLRKPYKENLDATTSSAEAQKEIRKIDLYLAANPNQTELYRYRAQHLRLMGMIHSKLHVTEYIDEAIKTLNAGLAIDPKDHKLFATIGTSHLFREDTKSAIANFHKAYAIDKGSVYTLRLGGRIAEATGKLDEAVKYYAAAVRVAENLEEKNKMIQSQAFLLCDLKRCDEGTALAEAQLNDKSHHWDIHNTSILFQQAGNHKKAIELSARALKKAPFGAAQSVMAASLEQEIKRRFDIAHAAKTVDLMADLEAFANDANKGSRYPKLIFVLSLLNSRVYSLQKDVERLNRAERYFKELNDMGPDHQILAGTAMFDIMASKDRVAGRVPPPYPDLREVTRRPSNTGQ